MQMYASRYDVHQAIPQNATNQIQKLPTSLLELIKRENDSSNTDIYVFDHQYVEVSLCTYAMTTYK
jgi:hypothetical protein